MKSLRSLPVVMPAVPGQRWSCHSCGDCCRTLVGHLFPHERDRLDEDGWAETLGVAPYVRLGREWVLNKREDGACVFLDGDNRCRIHAEHGEQAKPLACRIFPFTVRPTERGWQAALRFDCPSVTESRGEPIARHAQAVQSLADSMTHVPPKKRLRLKGRLFATPAEADGLIDRLIRWSDRNDVTTRTKFVVLARLASALSDARLKQVRGDRFLELVDLLIGGFAADEEKSLPATPVTHRQNAMTRQFVLACVEHVSLSEKRAGLIGRWRKRADQLSMAKKFLRGAGIVPPFRGYSRPVTFEDVQRVAPAVVETSEVEALLLRYLRSRLAADSVFGAGYYGWQVTTGLGALSMTLVAIAWVARYVAVDQGRTTLMRGDIESAVSMIDRGVTRVRVLGTMAERGRIAFLMQNEGVAHLARAYWMVDSQ